MNETKELVRQEDTTIAIIQAAPDALMLNESIVAKAVKTCTELLERMRKEGMSDELDAIANAAMVKLKSRHAEIKDRRSPATKIFDEIRSKFTELEAQIDPAKPSSVYGQLQAMRNAFATQKMEAQRKAEAERERKLKADQEKITLKSEAELQLHNSLNAAISTTQELLMSIFNAINLGNFTDKAIELQDYDCTYRKDMYDSIPVNLKAIYCSPAEIESIILNARLGKFDSFAKAYHDTLSDLKQELMDKLPGKKTELEELEAARLAKEDADKKAREAKTEADKKAAAEAAKKAEEQRLQLEAEAEERRKADAIRLQEERREAELKAAQEAEAKKAQEQTELLFNSTLEATENASEVKAAESFEIEVLNKSGWMEIFRFWFMKDGMTLDAEKIEKKTMKQMKSFCEAYYKKHNEKIDSAYIKYKPVYKVRAEK